jgi:acetylglutamate kinase
LTGVDAGFGRAHRLPPHVSTDGVRHDLGFVGDPVEAESALLQTLIRAGYVPVVASIGLEEGATSQLLNVNADVMACRIAASLAGCDLIIAGATAGVLDDRGGSIAALDLDGIADVIARGTATAGMVAKLAACRAALESGVASVRLVDGRTATTAADLDAAPGTTLMVRQPA